MPTKGFASLVELDGETILSFLFFSFFLAIDIIRSDIALDKQKGCKIAQHPDIMLELQREKAAQMHLVLLKEQLSNTYSNLTLTGKVAVTRSRGSAFSWK